MSCVSMSSLVVIHIVTRSLKTVFEGKDFGSWLHTNGMCAFVHERLPLQSSSEAQVCFLYMASRSVRYPAMATRISDLLARCNGTGAFSCNVRSVWVYAGSRISAQLLCRNVTPICAMPLALVLASIFLPIYPSSDIFDHPG